MGRKKKDINVQEVVAAAIEFRKKLKSLYLTSIHKSNNREFVIRAELSMLHGKYAVVAGMTPEQEAILFAHEEITQLIQQLSKYL